MTSENDGGIYKELERIGKRKPIATKQFEKQTNQSVLHHYLFLINTKQQS